MMRICRRQTELPRHICQRCVCHRKQEVAADRMRTELVRQGIDIMMATTAAFEKAILCINIMLVADHRHRLAA